MMQSKQFLLAGERYKSLLNVEDAVWLPDNPHISSFLAGHADLSCFYDGESRLYCAPHLKGIRFPLESKIINTAQSEKYPNDVQFNGFCINKHASLNKKYFSAEIIDKLESAGKCIVNVNQGYAKCCALIVGSNSLITSDTGIYAAATAAGIDVLKIEPGYIDLPGFDYGFLGGSGFIIDCSTIAFTGRLDAHPDKGNIKDFIRKHGKKIEYLSSRPVFDAGAFTVPSFSAL